MPSELIFVGNVFSMIFTSIFLQSLKGVRAGLNYASEGWVWILYEGGGALIWRGPISNPPTKSENRKPLPFSSSLWSGRRYHLLGEQPIVSVDHGAAHSTFLFQTNTQLLLWKHVSFTKIKLKLELFSFPGSSIPNNCHLYRPHDRP